MPVALICSPVDLQPELGHTVLWRGDFERRVAKGIDEAKAILRDGKPDVVLIDRDLPQANRLLLAIREDPTTQSLPALILARGPFSHRELDLKEVGANAVLRLPAGPDWDERLARLIEVPGRKDPRFPVHIAVEAGAGNEPVQATAVNLSTSGMLIESPVPLGVGQDVQLNIPLPDSATPVSGTGWVVREASSSHFGVEFRYLVANGLDRIRRFVESLTKL